MGISILQPLHEGKTTDLQDSEINIHLADTGLPVTPLDEGIRKSQPSPEGKLTFLLEDSEEELQGFSDEEILDARDDMETDQPPKFKEEP
nr:hypothetical protein [Tanacetum cinerariifolium]